MCARIFPLCTSEFATQCLIRAFVSSHIDLISIIMILKIIKIILALIPHQNIGKISSELFIHDMTYASQVEKLWSAYRSVQFSLSRIRTPDILHHSRTK